MTVGYIEWDEDVAVSNLAMVLLEDEFGAIARRGLEEDAPGAYELLDNVNLSVEQLAALELEIQEAGDPEQGTLKWLGENRETVEPFLPADT